VGIYTITQPSATGTLALYSQIPAAQVAANLASSGSTGVTGILPGANGGMGVANTGITETFAANFTTTGSGAPTLAFPATTPYTYTHPAYTGTMLEETASDTTTTHVLHASATTGVGTFGAIAAGDLPAALSSSSSINKVTVTAPATGSTLTIADGKTLTATNTMDVAKTAGVAGGIPWYDTTATESATALLAQYGVMIGGGASAAPHTATPSSTTTYAFFATATDPGFRAIAATDLPVVPTIVGSGTISTLAAPAGIVVCTTTCSVTVPAPVLGNQFCVRNDAGISTVITLSALGGGNYYELINHSGYGTANHTLVSGGATTDMICIVGRDSNHYLVASFYGTWAD
jgi:hypothetical protein